jgi:hypothetical protein
MLVRQFLDFNLTGPVYVNQIIPVPTCVEIAGDCKPCNRLGLRFQEMKPPFFIEVARQGPCNECEWDSSASSGCSSQRTQSSQRSCTASSKCSECRDTKTEKSVKSNADHKQKREKKHHHSKTTKTQSTK